MTLLKLLIEGRGRAGDRAAYPVRLDLCGAGLCVRFGVGAGQHGDCSAGVAVLVTYSPQNGLILLLIAFLISPYGLPKAGLLDAGQGAGLKLQFKIGFMVKVQQE